MNHFFAFFTGILVSLMIAFNGQLGQAYGLHTSSVVVHVVGLFVVSCFVLLKKEKPFRKGFPWFYYMGGVIGVLSVFLTNFSFFYIRVSAILALSLLGQSVMSIVVDHWGLFGMKKHPFQKRKFLGLLLLLCGIGFMVRDFYILALFLSFLSGVTIVLSRSLNAKLAGATSVTVGAFFNFFAGLLMAFLVYALLGSGEAGLVEAFAFSSFLPIYLGGAVGVFVVIINNHVVSKIPAFYFSLLLFIGQVFSGIVIDMFIVGTFSPANLIGAVFVAGGLCVNLFLDVRK